MLQCLKSLDDEFYEKKFITAKSMNCQSENINKHSYNGDITTLVEVMQIFNFISKWLKIRHS